MAGAQPPAAMTAKNCAKTAESCYGGKSGPYGPSWTRVDPRTVENYRDAAGLPSVNTGQFAIEGTVTDSRGVTVRLAQPLDNNIGGLNEVVIPNAADKVRINNVSGINPEY